MKTKGSTVWMYTAMFAAVLMLASCGNSQKKRERAEKRAMEQQIPVGTVVESETVVVEVDSIVPDSVAVQNRMNTPKRTK